MILAVLFANSDGNILIERYFPLPLVAEISSPSRCLMRSTGSAPLNAYHMGCWNSQVPWGSRGGEAPLALLPGEARIREPQRLQERGAPRCVPQVRLPPNLITLPHHQQLGFHSISSC